MISPDKLAVMDEEKLRRLHRNCLMNLDNPKLGEQAAALMGDIHREFTRRTTEERTEGFIPMLGCVGYQVRWRGLGDAERERLLDWILESDLPEINDSAYMASWGSPASDQRYRCLASTLRLYIERYGGGPLMEIALLRWDSDLGYVRRKADDEGKEI